jgi:predicted esterase
MQRILIWVLLALGAAGAAVILLRHRVPDPAPTQDMAVASEPAPEPPPDWCAPGFDPIAGDGCFAASAANRAPRPLLVYLHGRYARDAAAEELDRQRRLAARATARGFAVLALRGRLATCTAPELASWFCWPSNARNADMADAFVGTWARALATAEERAGSRSRFLLGFSNGGYFASLIASRGLLDVEAVVVAHGGFVEPARVQRHRPPLLLLSADDDVAQDDMIAYDEELTREQWAHESYARAGGHALSDEDIDAALTFFVRAKEPLPLQPPLPLHRAVRHAREAGPAPAPDESAAPTAEDNAIDEAPDAAADEAPSKASDEADDSGS